MLQRAKEQAYQSYQTRPTYQAPQPQKQPPTKKENGFSTFLAIILVLAIPIGLMLLDDAGAFDTPKSNNNQQTVQSPPKTETTPPPAVIIPRSGDILSGTECFDGSELTITADSGSSCVVKLKTASGDIFSYIQCRL